MSELLFRSAVTLAAMIRSGELGAVELVRESLERIDERQPQVNAFAHVAHDEALAAAQEIGAGDERPFAGVPIAIKDNRPVAGMPLSVGSELFADFVSPHDAFLVRRLKRAGFVVVGKTTLPEMGILATTETRRFGPTRNPWALDRTPGGSSGGSAAAVAAGMVPIAHGNDGGGSIRIPAACCGLVGLKPARGRVSGGPDQGESFLVSDGVLTRDVADTAAALDVLAGYEPGDASWAPSPSRPYAEACAGEPGRRRIAVTLTPPLSDAPLDPECERAARQAAELLTSLGHDVEEVEPPWQGTEMLPEFRRVYAPMISIVTRLGGLLSGQPPDPDRLEPLTWAMWEEAQGLSSVEVLAAIGALQAFARGIVDWMGAYDALLTPAVAQRPPRIGEIHGCRTENPWSGFDDAAQFTPYAGIANVTGQPAITVPLYQGTDGLPTAVQLIGPPVGEDLLLGLAAQLERALPWSERQAPL